MTGPAHSPEPFSADETPLCFIVRDAIGDSIGTLALFTGDHTIEEQRANAHLFAASPLLLAALKGLIDVRPCNWDDDDEDPEQAEAWRAADAAVALAEACS